MTTVVTDLGVQLSDSNDILAAFDSDGNVRGTSFALDVSFGPYDGTVLHEITLRSNSAGDNLTFQFYDASEDAVLDLSENYSFIVNDIVGSMVDPHALSVQYEVDLSIDLIAGWNWLGYLPQNPGNVGEALESLGVNADFINSQVDGASQIYASIGGPWAGALSTLEPGKGYLLKMLAPATFTYPEFDGLVRLNENKQEVVLNSTISDWDFHYGDYEFIGTITASIESHVDNDGDVVAVFVDGECRGIAERMHFPLDDTYYYMIQVYSNDINGEEITFKYYDKTNDEVVEYSETLTFENNMIVGDGFNTFGLSREIDLSQPKAYSIGEAYPNPFNPVTSFEYTMPEDGMVQIAVYDISGRMVAELVDGYQSAGSYPVTWDAQELSSGVYMVSMTAGNYSTIQKLMLIK